MLLKKLDTIRTKCTIEEKVRIQLIGALLKEVVKHLCRSSSYSKLTGLEKRYSK